MDNKITKCILPYPPGYEPNYIIPNKYCKHRYAIGKIGKKPLVAICMNPSAASDEFSDRTVNRIINISKKTGMDGWIVFNIYPERATDARNLGAFDERLSINNMEVIKKYLIENSISEVWAAWGDDRGIQTLIEGKKRLCLMLENIGIKIYYYGTLTKACNPRHPLQRKERWSFASDNKHYL